MKYSENLYYLNKKNIDIRYSREYLFGNRIAKYLKIISNKEILYLIKIASNDLSTLIKRKKQTPSNNVRKIDFSQQYTKDKIAVYTSIYGKYDTIKNPLYSDNNCDYYIFTDQILPKTCCWKKIDYSFPDDINTDFLKNRYIKMFPNQLFPEYKYSLYIDGNIEIVSEVSLLFKDFESKTGIAMYSHPNNSDLFEEISTCVMEKKISKSEGILFKQKLIKENFPSKFGLTECNVIFREHSNTNCIDIMEKWWSYLLEGPKRDQLHFSRALFTLGFSMKDIFIIGDNINFDPMFIRNVHNNRDTVK